MKRGLGRSFELKRSVSMAGWALFGLAIVAGSGGAQGKPTTLLAAHRGGALLWPENSLLAFRNAVALGCDFVEFDVHQTADGEVAVIHDHTLDRTSEGRGAVGAATATALRRLRLKGRDGGLTDERVPLLEDVLALVAASPAALL